jgi:hypothetical protein
MPDDTQSQPLDTTAATMTLDASTVQEPQTEVEEVAEAQEIEALPEWAQDYIGKLRKESAARRVESANLSKQMEELTHSVSGIIRQMSPTVDTTVDAEGTENGVNTLIARFDEQARHLLLDNARMRVVAETGLDYDVVAVLAGQDYATLSEAAKVVTSLQKPQEIKPVANKPPRVPNADTVPVTTDLDRRAKYFSSSGGGNSSIFSKI